MPAGTKTGARGASLRPKRRWRQAAACGAVFGKPGPKLSPGDESLLGENRGGTPADAGRFMPARKRRAVRATEKGGLRHPPLAGALACRRSTAVLAKGTFVPRAQLRARLPEDGATRCGLPPAPFRSQRSTSRAGPSAGRHDARAARERAVSSHPRAPHSLRLRKVPSPKASL